MSRAGPLEPWRLLEHWEGEPGFHMALDEALLLTPGTPATLRFYTWEPAALSLGYFQRYADVAPHAGKRTLVRRMTGGGAIHHTAELTFSIACELEHPLYRGEVRDSYLRVHAILTRALEALGLHSSVRAGKSLQSDRPGSMMCFHRSTSIDLVWDGAKGVGSAQRRKAGRVLHHGSIKLAGSELETGVAEVRGYAPELTPKELSRHVARAFEEIVGAKLEAGELLPEEEAHAREHAGRFGSREFLRRR